MSDLGVHSHGVGVMVCRTGGCPTVARGGGVWVGGQGHKNRVEFIDDGLEMNDRYESVSRTL